MSLRRRILLIIGLTLIALIVGAHFLATTILLDRFTRLEQENAERDVQRVRSALADELANLRDKAADWSVWDDTYAFMNDRNQAFVDSNLGDTAFVDLKLNAMLFIDQSGRIVFQKGFNRSRGIVVPVPGSLLQQVRPDSPLLKHADVESVRTGVLMLPEGPLLLVARPIVTSRRQGPVRGTLIFARWFDDGEIERLGRRTHLSVSLQRCDEEERFAGRFLNNPQDILIEPLNENVIAGYTLVPDVYGQPAFVMRVKLWRDIYHQGVATIRYLLTTLLAAGLIFGAVAVLLLERLVLARLGKLVADIGHVRTLRDPSARVAVGGRDELSRLGHAINQMLDALHAANAQRQESQRALTTLMSNLPGMVYRCRNDRERTIEFVSDGCRSLTGYQPDDLLNNQRTSYAALIHPDDREPTWTAMQAALRENRPYQLSYRLCLAEGQNKWAWEQGRGVYSPQGELLALEGFVSDVTDRKKLEEQILQGQKVEAVGRLAGGIAHDFNNILTAIGGYAELLLRRLPARDALRRNAQEIKQATDRAASLTRQLLAFSRKQTLQPRVLDLRVIVAELDKMLRRLIGEDIELCTVLGASVGSVKADPAQITQVLMNLAVNARDAMPTGGRLTISIANAHVNGDKAHRYKGVAPGDYVVLSVADTGVGMTPEVRAHLFEPFFTTKPQGKGTGLGLATCYGIVVQSGGHIAVETEPGYGTTFYIYLPRIAKPESTVEPLPSGAVTLPTGHETILVAEDEPAVRELAVTMLRDLGYTVLEAANGEEGRAMVCEQADQRIDLLFTDVVMPQMGGKQLADWIQQTRPETRVLFTSGYTADEMLRHGVREDRIAFLEKPFTPVVLAYKIREVLDVSDRSVR